VHSLDSTGSGYGPATGCCEDGNKLSGSIEGAESLTTLTTISF
jgi:hypothetical protein